MSLIQVRRAAAGVTWYFQFFFYTMGEAWGSASLTAPASPVLPMWGLASLGRDTGYVFCDSLHSTLPVSVISGL
jgi:hypothetical protein